jgi:hypothetical protein
MGWGTSVQSVLKFHYWLGGSRQDSPVSLTS